MLSLVGLAEISHISQADIVLLVICLIDLLIMQFSSVHFELCADFKFVLQVFFSRFSAFLGYQVLLVSSHKWLVRTG